MGKTFLLLIAIISCLGAEYVKSASPVKSTEFFEFSGISENSKNSKTLDPAGRKQNSKQKIQTQRGVNKIQNTDKNISKNSNILENSKNSNKEKYYKKADLADFTSSKYSKIVTGQKSEEYIFWAKFFTTNQMLSTRIIAFSKAMKTSDEDDFKPFCQLKKPRVLSQSELEYFKANEEELADCFTKSPFYALEYSNYLQNSAKLKTNLKTNITQIPVHFIAIFKADGAIILAKIEN